MAIILTTQDKELLKQYYPKLNCSLSRKLVWGTLDFACSFDKSSQELFYDNSANDYLADSYEIRIDFNHFNTFGFPEVYESSGIIRAFAQKQGIKPEDFHIKENGEDSCCLGIFPEYQWRGVVFYIQEKVVPFFYWQACRRIYGKEPWGSYSHRDNGIIEAMTILPPKASKGASRNLICPCGSGKKYKKCCMNRDAFLKSKLGEGH